MRAIIVLIVCLSTLCSASDSEVPSLTLTTIAEDLVAEKESTIAPMPVPVATDKTSSSVPITTTFQEELLTTSETTEEVQETETVSDTTSTSHSHDVNEVNVDEEAVTDRYDDQILDDHILDKPKEKSISSFSNYTAQLQNYTQILGQQLMNLIQKNQTKVNDEADSERGHGIERETEIETETENETQDVHIQDLLRGILVDEFGTADQGSIEADSEESNAFFSDDSDEDHDHDSKEDEQTVTTTTTSTTVSSTLKITSQDEAEVAEQNDILKETKAELDADIIKERSSRSDISYEKHSDDEKNGDGLTKSARARGQGKEQSGKDSVNKYNRYVDAVFKRMNSLIRAKRMDPLRVNLYAGNNANASHHGNNNGHSNNNNNGNANGHGNGNGNGNGGKMNKKKNNANGKNKKKGGAAGAGAGSGAGAPGKNVGHNKNRNSNNNNKNNKIHNKRAKNNHSQQHNNKRRGNTRPRLYLEEDGQHKTAERGHSQRRGRAETTSMKPEMDNKMRPSSFEGKGNNKTSSETTSPVSSATEGSTTSFTGSVGTTTHVSESKEMKGQSNSNSSNNRPTRGVLHGLSTLRRAGAVKVIRQGPNVRLVRAKFLLGPVALDILSKKAGNSSKSSNAASATATARSLKGVLEIRLKNSGPTRIRRLRVFPPSNVRVEGETNGMKKQGYRKITPVAARRLMSVANQVVRQSDNRNPPKKTKKPNNKPATKKGVPKNTNVKRNNKLTRTRSRPTRPHQRN